MKRSTRASLPIAASLLLFGAPSFAQSPPPAPPTAPDAAAAPTAPLASAPTPAPGYAPPPPAPVTPPQGSSIELTTLRILLNKGIISQAEYDSASRDMGDSVGTKVGDTNTVVMGKWATTMYGFIEADSIYDSTQSFNESAGNGTISKPGTYGQDNGRVQFGARNSRIGFRLKAPEVAGIRTSAVAEMDFLGNQNPIGTGVSGTGTDTEAQYYTNPAFRARHLYLKVETDVVDFLFGQYWQLFGWQSGYHPASVEIQGLPGQVYSRTPQIRISKTVKTDDVIFEAAVAAMRPVQRDSALPGGQAGIRIAFPALTGVITNGSTGTSVQPASIAVTGDARQIRLPNYYTNPNDVGGGSSRMGTGFAVDAVIPIIPAKVRQGNSLTVNGEFATSYGAPDLYTGLSGGATVPVYGATAKAAAATNADIDPGIAVYDNTGGVHLIQWTSYLVGVQYTIPGLDGKTWLALNYSHIQSANLGRFYSGVGKVLGKEDFYDANLFQDVGAAVRLGLEYAMFDDLYANSDIHARNNRVQFSAWYIF